MGTGTLRLLLRVFLHVEDEARARDVLQTVIEPTLAPHAGMRDVTIEQYWKIPEWFEITLELDPTYEAHAVYDRLVALAEAGWTRSDDAPGRDAVWNPANSAVFLAPEVRWAHLQLWAEDEDTP